MFEWGFTERLITLVCVLILVAAADWQRYRSRAKRWREYSFLLTAGAIGALFGLANDQVTCSISPEYFTVGKGIAPGDGFRWNVAVLGAQAGFVGGAVIGCFLLFANHPRLRRPALSFWELLKLGRYPFLAIAYVLPVTILIAVWLDPLRFESALAELLSREEIKRFLIVWGIHLGLYAGGTLGCMWAIFRMLRRSSDHQRIVLAV